MLAAERPGSLAPLPTGPSAVRHRRSCSEVVCRHPGRPQGSIASTLVRPRSITKAIVGPGTERELLSVETLRVDDRPDGVKRTGRHGPGTWASGWSSLTTSWGLPCCVRFPCVHAVATTPAQRLEVLLRSLPPAVSAFPERVVGSACASSFSRLARRSLALRPRCHQCVTR